MIQIKIIDGKGAEKFSVKDTKIDVVYEGEYNEGDKIVISKTDTEYLSVKIDDTLAESLIFVPISTFEFPIPFGELKKGYDNKEELEELLSYARKNVPYYENIKSNKLEEFPVVCKEVMKGGHESFRSKEYLDESKVLTVYTSGSSGTPFKAYQNQEKDDFHKAALILKNKEIGWNVGDRWAHLRNWGFGAPASKAECLKKNMVPLSILDLDDEKLENIVQTLIKDRNLNIILSYSSGLERLVEYIKRKKYTNYDFGIKLIIADSDNLKKEVWNSLEEIFKCPVLNRYASIENAIIAITKPNDRAFYIDTTQFYVEILKMDQDISVEEGEMGRIVVTDFHNKAMPFIRYANGDLAVAKKIVDGQCVEIESLEGREISALRKTDGTLLSETNIMGRFKQFVEICRYQIIQTSEKSYIMRLEGATADVDEKCLLEMKKIFGDDAEVTIEHTDHIKCGSNGKFKVTISEI